ncbi:hypothetical protein D3C87_1631990 [compost metagenome]
MCTPSGSDWLIASTLSLIRAMTARLFSPRSIITIPLTTSPWALAVTAPWRTSGPTTTWAMSFTKIGTPLRLVTTVWRMSFRFSARPRPRTMYCSWLYST